MDDYGWIGLQSSTSGIEPYLMSYYMTLIKQGRLVFSLGLFRVVQHRLYCLVHHLDRMMHHLVVIDN